MTLTNEQVAALRYYTGDVTGSDPFWGNAKAYVVLNALFYPGIMTERARAAEGKRLDPAILGEQDRLCRLLAVLLSVFRCCKASQPMHLCRVERFSDYLLHRERGATVSFTSTSTAGFLDAYRDRRGIALMHYRVPAGTPCIPMAEVLPVYAKAEEAEVLLPPFLKLTLQEQPLTAEEARISDADGQPPAVAVTAWAGEMQPPEPLPLPSGGRQAGQRVLCALAAGQEPDPADAAAYSRWKRAVVSRAWYEAEQIS